MGLTILILFVAVMALCFCVYNWWDLRERNKRMFEHEKKKINPFNSYTAWGIYALVILLAILGFAGYEIMQLMNSVMDYQG